MSADMFGIMDGIGCETPNKKAIMCENFIKKISQMDGAQLAHFMDDPTINLDGFILELHFRIPPSSEFIECFLRETKRDGRNVAGEDGYTLRGHIV